MVFYSWIIDIAAVQRELKARMNLHLAVVGLGILASTAFGTPMLEGLWQKWKEEHAKVYSGAEDEQTRKTLWIENYHRIKRHNEGGNSYTLGLNQFSDMVRMII